MRTGTALVPFREVYEVPYTFWAGDSKAAERAIHEALEEHKHEREWFFLDAREAAILVVDIILDHITEDGSGAAAEEVRKKNRQSQENWRKANPEAARERKRKSLSKLSNEERKRQQRERTKKYREKKRSALK